eukprot:TRINITY_DN5802_c0_g1_i1.p1 TRINITY_DN5802_c0_g1~~TRINITY_DN5802_c0_g1_i1.p1  ORF type:complete len:855 (+),score=115.89 TRINITY_DN5802_c0_g1_i1:76-2640(+)
MRPNRTASLGGLLRPTWWQQFKILMKKNFLLKRRNLRMSLLEVLFPLYWVGILVAVKYGLGGSDAGVTTVATAWDIEFSSIAEACQNYTSASQTSGCIDIGYAPTGEPYDSIISDLASFHYPRLRVAGFNSSIDLENYYFDNPMGLASGIVFESPDGLSYAIKMNESVLTGRSASEFIASGFADLQTSLLQSILNFYKPKNESRVSLDLQASRMPLLVDTNLFKTILPLYFPFIFAYSIAQLVIFVVTEKSVKLREHMRMAGLRDSVYWISWLFTQLIFVIISTIPFEGLLYATGIFRYTNPFLIFLMFFGYAFSLLSFGLILVTFLDVPKTAGAFAALFQIIGTAIMAGAHYLIFPRPGLDALKQSLGTVNTVPLGEMMAAISAAEAAGQSLTFASQWNWLAWLFGDALIYILIAWYTSNVVAGEFGTSRPFYFFLQKSYWSPKNVYRQDEQSASPLSRLLSDSGDGVGSKDSIEIINLRREFNRSGKPLKCNCFRHGKKNDNKRSGRGPPVLGSIQDDPSEESILVDDDASSIATEDDLEREDEEGPLVAVKDLNLSIAPGEIFALLGHNGAGKSTTIKIVSGALQPTSGTVLVNGHDLSQYTEEIRRRMGVCDQADVLFESLTPAEHLRMFGLLKGVPEERIEQEIDEKLEEVLLTEHRDKEVSELSGGMKRKLCTAIAFLGAPLIVFLDECTAGLDPHSRSKIWELLQKYKGKTSIIMTTHFMEEADSLGDRICIMSKGSITALGTSVELKNKFGVGYQLILLKQELFNRERTEELLAENLDPSLAPVRLLSDNMAEISYQVPFVHVPKFPTFIRNLKAAQLELGVKSFVLQPTTLEEVFLHLAKSEENE